MANQKKSSESEPSSSFRGEARTRSETFSERVRAAEKLGITRFTVRLPVTEERNWNPVPDDSLIVSVSRAVEEVGVDERVKEIIFHLSGRDLFFSGGRMSRFAEALFTGHLDERGRLFLQLPPETPDVLSSERTPPQKYVVEAPADRGALWHPPPPNYAAFSCLRDAIIAVGGLKAGRRIEFELPGRHLVETSLYLQQHMEAQILAAPAKGDIRINLSFPLPELTAQPELRQSHEVREGRQQKKDVLDQLDELARPKPVPPEIETLARILEQAKSEEPPDKERFIAAVNKALERHSFAIRVDSTGEICRRLALDRNGYIMFQPTHGGVRGFKGNEFTLVPYERPYRRSTPKKK